MQLAFGWKVLEAAWSVSHSMQTQNLFLFEEVLGCPPGEGTPKLIARIGVMCDPVSV